MYDDPRGPQSVPRVYSGVFADAYCVRNGFDVLLLCIIDAPLSLVADTLVLPYKGYQQVKYGNYAPRLVPEMHREHLRQRERDERDARRLCPRILAQEPASEDAEECRKLIAADGGTPVDIVREKDAGTP